ncbi:MAG: helix-turn-helix domain-containing protein [Actinomycetia bacterium]|nr:helix-turn-helix domain-containing protein [Actinomycetes bacterium]
MEDSTEGRAYDAVRAAYPPMLNTAQVAELLDLNPRTVLAMAGDGRLPASRLPGGRKFHFLLEDILSTLAANRVSPSADTDTTEVDSEAG